MLTVTMMVTVKLVTVTKAKFMMKWATEVSITE